MRDGKLSKVTLETRIRANVRKNGGPCSTLRYIFSSWMRENIHDVQSSCFIFLFPFFWVVCYFIWLRVQCNLFHPILFHPISLTIFSKPCICHVVTRMTMNTWVWQRIFPILYFMPWNYIIAYKMHRFGICSSRKQIPLWGMCLLKLKKNELVDLVLLPRLSWPEGLRLFGERWRKNKHYYTTRNWNAMRSEF